MQNYIIIANNERPMKEASLTYFIVMTQLHLWISENLVKDFQYMATTQTGYLANTYVKLLRIYNVDCSSLSFWQYNLTKNPLTDISVLEYSPHIPNYRNMTTRHHYLQTFRKSNFKLEKRFLSIFLILWNHMPLHYWLMGKPTCLGIFTNSFCKKSGTYVCVTVIICYCKNAPIKKKCIIIIKVPHHRLICVSQ
jgi:hypothetical protein